ncbi:MAG: hypothetical protein INR65_07725, partial [Gluconacetobacter diazotrophicus]|nr:hypothetical protein [Gluconacetobacter diazotrophicus]
MISIPRKRTAQLRAATPRAGTLVVLAAVACGTLPGVAGAQTSLNPSQRVSTPLNQGQFAGKSSVPSLPQPEALFPTIFGAGTWLRDHGIAVLLDNTNEFSGAFAGGADKG